MRYVVVLCLLTAALSGCLPDPLPVDDIQALKPRIVVSTQIVPDQSLVVLLTRSFGALDANNDSDIEVLLEQIAINDATVILEGNGLTDTLTFVETGVYATTFVDWEPGATYSLSVISPSMGTVTSTARVEPPVIMESVQGKIYDTGFDTLAQIDYAYEDLPHTNYYMVNVQHVTTAETPEAEDFLNPDVFTHLVESGSEADGALVLDSFRVFFRRDFIPGDTVTVQMANISEAYYDFLQLRKDNRFNFSDVLGEPINYPTNIEGGLGWFTLHLPDVRIIILEE
jgi:hypothetical protein